MVVYGIYHGQLVRAQDVQSRKTCVLDADNTSSRWLELMNRLHKRHVLDRSLVRRVLTTLGLVQKVWVRVHVGDTGTQMRGNRLARAADAGRAVAGESHGKIADLLRDADKSSGLGSL